MELHTHLNLRTQNKTSNTKQDRISGSYSNAHFKACVQVFPVVFESCRQHIILSDFSLAEFCCVRTLHMCEIYVLTFHIYFFFLIQMCSNFTEKNGPFHFIFVKKRNSAIENSNKTEHSGHISKHVNDIDHKLICDTDGQ